jgi:Fe-S-cluster containining protein
MSDASNICLSCGICCDGTLIGFVQLDPEELPRLSKFMEFEKANELGFFLQPCKKFCDGCTVYADRPKQCGIYKCDLLKSCEAQETDFDSAVAIVNDAKQQKLSIEKQLATLQIELKSPSFFFQMVELKNLLEKKKAEASMTPSHLALKSDLEQLDSLLLEKFGVTFN